jgi:hypothetical protein
MDLYLYIVNHPKFDQDWIKLGRTVNLDIRLKGYQTGCPFREYKLLYSKLLPEDTVTMIENYFSAYVQNNGFEWFKCSLEEAIKHINEIIEGSKTEALDLETTRILARNPYNQRFKYYAFTILDEYSYLEEQEFPFLDNLIKHFKLTYVDAGKISKLFKGKHKIEYKGISIRRKNFKYELL